MQGQESLNLAFNTYLEVANLMNKKNGSHHRNLNSVCYNEKVDSVSTMLFENLPDLITPQVASIYLEKSVTTIYDWKYRGKTRKDKIPPNLFIKLSGGLYLRKEILKMWISTRSSSS